MTRQALLLLLLLAVAALAPQAPAALADDGDDDHVARAGDVRVVHAWARATDGTEGEVFMDIESLGAADRLTGASTPAAGSVEIHGAILAQGTASSLPLGEVEIPAGGEFVLEPGAVFLKLLDLKRPLARGEAFPVELRFAAAGPLEVEVEVEAADATAHGHAGHAH